MARTKANRNGNGSVGNSATIDQKVKGSVPVGSDDGGRCNEVKKKLDFCSENSEYVILIIRFSFRFMCLECSHLSFRVLELIVCTLCIFQD